MIFIGIDPGKGKGAVAAVSEDGDYVEHEHFDTWSKAVSFLDRMNLIGKLYICIEDLWGMPIRGSQGNFGLGGNCEGWKAIIEIRNYSLAVEAAPQTWQKKILPRFKSGDSKKASIEYVNKRYPQLQLPTRRKIDIDNSCGPADAICLALYGRYSINNVL